MQSTDLGEFVKLLEALCAGFNLPITNARKDAYWRGLASMNLLAFERIVDHVLGPNGEEELPGPKQLWSIHHRLMREQRANSRVPTKPEREFDVFEQYANRVLTWVLRSLAREHRAAASDASLAKMLHVKQIFVTGYREQCKDEPDASLEFRDVLIEKLTAAFEPREQTSSNKSPLVPAAQETWNPLAPPAEWIEPLQLGQAAA